MRHEQHASSQSNLQDDLENLKDDLAHLREDVGELIQSVIAAGRGRVGDVAQRMRNELQQKVKRMGEQRDSAMASVQRQFESHPLIAVGTAFGLGLVLGALLQRGD